MPQREGGCLVFRDTDPAGVLFNWVIVLKKIIKCCRSCPKPFYSLCILFRIRESYSASDINSNSGKIWAITTVYPSQLFEGTKFRVNVSINAAQTLHLLPQGKKTRKQTRKSQYQ